MFFLHLNVRNKIQRQTTMHFGRRQSWHGGWTQNTENLRVGTNGKYCENLKPPTDDRVIQLCDEILRKIKPGVSMSDALAKQMFSFDRGDRQLYPLQEGCIRPRYKVERENTIGFENFYTALRNWFGRGTRENLAHDKNKQHPARIVRAPVTRDDARLLFDALAVEPGSATISLADMAARKYSF
jgi:hypothetical protein